MVLLGEDLGGGHDGPLVAPLDRDQQRRHGDHGLARTHVPLEQAVHGTGTGQVAQDLGEGLVLGLGEGEGQAATEPPEQVLLPGDGVGDAHRLALEGPLAGDQLRLQAEELIEGQALPRPLGVGHGGRTVDVVEGLAPPHQTQVGKVLGRHRVLQLGHPPQRLGDALGQLPGGDPRLLGLGIDGDDAAGAVPDQVHHRVGHLQPPPVGLDPAEDRHVLAGLELAGPPGLVEERQPQVGPAVGDVDLDQGAPLPGATGVHTPDGGEHRGLLPRGQLADGRLPCPVDVAVGVVGEQVVDRGDPHVLEGPGPLGPHPLDLGHRNGVQVGEGPPLGSAHSMLTR
jgi:hypothetical protein